MLAACFPDSSTKDEEGAAEVLMTGRPWLDFASEQMGLEKWQFEEQRAKLSQEEILKDGCRQYCKLARSSAVYDVLAEVQSDFSQDITCVGPPAEMEHRQTPADLRMTALFLLPRKLDSELHRRQQQRAQGTLQGGPQGPQKAVQGTQPVAQEAREHALPP
ncbi:hypothetical protein ABPG75_000238 [Micractinium tetrahymenae]